MKPRHLSAAFLAITVSAAAYTIWALPHNPSDLPEVQAHVFWALATAHLALMCASGYLLGVTAIGWSFKSDDQTTTDADAA